MIFIQILLGLAAALAGLAVFNIVRAHFAGGAGEENAYTLPAQLIALILALGFLGLTLR